MTTTVTVTESFTLHHMLSPQASVASRQYLRSADAQQLVVHRTRTVLNTRYFSLLPFNDAVIMQVLKAVEMQISMQKYDSNKLIFESNGLDSRKLVHTKINGALYSNT